MWKNRFVTGVTLRELSRNVYFLSSNNIQGGKWVEKNDNERCGGTTNIQKKKKKCRVYVRLLRNTLYIHTIYRLDKLIPPAFHGFFLFFFFL